MRKPADNLSTLLSQTLVAFTIELDNEFEHRMPHRTAHFGGDSGPWLVSMAMYLNCMRYVDDAGISVKDLERAARTHTNLDGMRRWGYVMISPDKILRPTVKGAMARDIWKPLVAEIEARWVERFGIARLRAALEQIDLQLDPSLLDCMPILKYGLVSSVSKLAIPPAERDRSLPAMLARVLLAIAIEFESKSPFSLAICANVLRVLDEEGVRVAETPALSGVSKESIAMAMGILTKHKLVALGKDSASRRMIARLTTKGIVAKEAYPRFLSSIEARWERAEPALKDALQAIQPRLFEGLEPYPDGWRAKVAKPTTLPHFPMVLHRGGFPDGA